MADESKKIRISSVKRNDYGLSIGHKIGNEWDNYYCNEESVCQILEGAKGQDAFVTYYTKVKNNKPYHVITGATLGAPQQTGNNAQPQQSNERSYNMQNCVKAAAHALSNCLQEMSPGDTPQAVGTYIGEVAKVIYEQCYAENPLKDMVDKAQQTLDARPEDPDEDIPFD